MARRQLPCTMSTRSAPPRPGPSRPSSGGSWDSALFVRSSSSSLGRWGGVRWGLDVGWVGLGRRRQKVQDRASACQQAGLARCQWGPAERAPTACSRPGRAPLELRDQRGQRREAVACEVQHPQAAGGAAQRLPRRLRQPAARQQQRLEAGGGREEGRRHGRDRGGGRAGEVQHAQAGARAQAARGQRREGVVCVRGGRRGRQAGRARRRKGKLCGHAGRRVVCARVLHATPCPAPLHPARPAPLTPQVDRLQHRHRRGPAPACVRQRPRLHAAAREPERAQPLHRRQPARGAQRGAKAGVRPQVRAGEGRGGGGVGELRGQRCEAAAVQQKLAAGGGAAAAGPASVRADVAAAGPRRPHRGGGGRRVGAVGGLRRGVGQARAQVLQQGRHRPWWRQGRVGGSVAARRSKGQAAGSSQAAQAPRHGHPTPSPPPPRPPAQISRRTSLRGFPSSGTLRSVVIRPSSGGSDRRLRGGGGAQWGAAP
jgi:hypothetical protein